MMRGNFYCELRLIDQIDDESVRSKIQTPANWIMWFWHLISNSKIQIRRHQKQPNLQLLALPSPARKTTSVTPDWNSFCSTPDFHPIAGGQCTLRLISIDLVPVGVFSSGVYGSEDKILDIYRVDWRCWKFYKMGRVSFSFMITRHPLSRLVDFT